MSKMALFSPQGTRIMTLYCAECRSGNTEKTGKQRHHAYQYECQDCGHTFYWG